MVDEMIVMTTVGDKELLELGSKLLCSLKNEDDGTTDCWTVGNVVFFAEGLIVDFNEGFWLGKNVMSKDGSIVVVSIAA